MVRNILASFVAVIGLVALYLIWTPAAPKPSARQPASAPNVEIAPTSDALSFARLGKQTIAVSSYANGRITGLPVGNSGEDAISLVNRLGYDGVRALIAAGGTPADWRGVHDIRPDRVKEGSRRACRRRVEHDED